MATRPIVIGIQGDTSRLKKALDQAERGVKGFAKNVGALGVKAGAAFGGAAAAVGVVGVNAAADFEKSMREVLTLLPEAGADTFGQLSDQVKDFSKDFGVLPGEVIPSLYQALSAGVPQDNVFEFLEVAQQAAKGGVTDLSVAVDGITSVVNSYGADVISATEASDLMFTAVRLGKTDFEQLSGSLFQVAPIAASLGVEFQDVTAALANLTAQGVPTNVAATQLKGAFAELGKEGTKADEAFREIAGVGFTDFISAGGNVQQAFTLMSEGAEAQNKSVLDLFGSIEAGQSVLALTADGGVAFQESLGAMGDSAGATQTAFDTMDQGLSANFDRIKANIEVLKIEIGQRLAPLVIRATDFIISNFDKFKDIAEEVREKVVEISKKAFEIFNKVLDKSQAIFNKHIIPAFHKFVDVSKQVLKFVVDNKKEFIFLGSVVGGAAVAFKTAQLAQKGYTKITKTATAIQKFFNVTLMANPMMLYAAAIGAVVAALIYAYTESEAFRGFINQLFSFLKDMFIPVFHALKDAVMVAFDFIIMHAEYLWTQIQLFVDLIKAVFNGDFGEALDILKDMVSNAINFAVDTFLFLPRKLIEVVGPTLKNAVMDYIVDPIMGFKDKAGEIIDDVVDFFLGLPSTLIGLYLDYLNAGKNLASGLISGMVQGIKGAAGFTIGLAKDIINAISGFINDNLITPFNDLLEFTIPIPFAKDITINPPDIPPIPELAKGGIVRGQQLALLGDNPSGTEAVLPLERANEFGFGGNGINITVNAGFGADGTQIGAQIVQLLKQYERNNGAIPITVQS